MTNWQGLQWKIDDKGNLVVTLEDFNQRIELLDQLYPVQDRDQIHADISDEMWNALLEVRRGWESFVSPRAESWCEIEQEWYEPLWTNGFECQFCDQEVFALYSGPIIFEGGRTDAGEYEVTGRVWTDNNYVFFDSAAGIDTLAKTGKAVWSPVPLEDEEE